MGCGSVCVNSVVALLSFGAGSLLWGIWFVPMLFCVF